MGRGLGRPLLRLGLMEAISVDASVGDVCDVGEVGDVGDSERHVEEIRGVLLVVGETSSVWRSASGPCWSDVA